MKIKINGKEREYQPSASLREIINKFCKNNQKIIAEVNGQIIKNPQWDQTPIKEGDQIELINFVGGG